MATPAIQNGSQISVTFVRCIEDMNGTKRTSRNVRYLVAFGGEADIRPIYEYAP